MRLARFLRGSEIRIGAVVGDAIVDFKEAYAALFGSEAPPALRDMRAFIEAGNAALELARLLERAAIKESINGALVAAESVKLLPPVEPEKLLCVAVNYHSHAKEMGTQPPERPYFFAKLRNSIVGHKDPVVIPRGAEKPDHEVELAVVIGRPGKYIEESKALEHVFGYTIVNDVSLRDRQFRPGEQRLGARWLAAKSFDTAAPLGPYIVTRDEIEDPQSLRLELYINGELRQSGNSKDMIFPIAKLIAEASDGMTLRAGDVISTGTPAGVGAASGRFLRHGDIMEARIERIGALINPVIYEAFLA